MKSYKELVSEALDAKQRMTRSIIARRTARLRQVTRQRKKFKRKTEKELGKILSLSLDCEVSPDVLTQLSSVVRGNARNAKMRAKDINLYAASENIDIFDRNHYNKFCETLGILPFGISCTEKQILQVLAECGACTLSMLGAKTGLSTSSLRSDHEKYLLKQNLMEIDVKRKLTFKGRKLAKKI